MTTKEDIPSKRRRTSRNVNYNNFNLTSYNLRGSSNVEFQSTFKSQNTKRNRASNWADTNKTETSTKKFGRKQKHVFQHDDDIQLKQNKNDELFQSQKKSGSTLSLHIAAYENSVEAASNDETSDNSSEVNDSSLTNSQPLMPRQQQSEKGEEPEIQRFTLSTKLFDPSQKQGVVTRSRGRILQQGLEEEEAHEKAAVLPALETVAAESDSDEEAKKISSRMSKIPEFDMQGYLQTMHHYGIGNSMAFNHLREYNGSIGVAVRNLGKIKLDAWNTSQIRMFVESLAQNVTEDGEERPADISNCFVHNMVSTLNISRSAVLNMYERIMSKRCSHDSLIFKCEHVLKWLKDEEQSSDCQDELMTMFYTAAPKDENELKEEEKERQKKEEEDEIEAALEMSKIWDKISPKFVVHKYCKIVKFKGGLVWECSLCERPKTWEFAEANHFKVYNHLRNLHRSSFS